jgi:DNA-binding MarR family transcriptional regulator
MERDAVDELLDQWRRERPDVDVSGMAIIGRISRIERRLRPRLGEVFARHGLEAWEFDVLATLRRSGPPFALTAGELLESMMVTSGGVTHRIKRLEQRGLVRREPDSRDRRIVHVSLTDDGHHLIDAALPDHADNETRLLSGLSDRDRQTLARLLRRLHNLLDHDAAARDTHDPEPG